MGLPFCEHSVALRCQRNPFYSTVLLYTYISQFSVNPHHRQKRKSRRRCHRNSVPNRFSSRFLTSPTNGPRSLSQTKMGTHSAFRERSHTRAHTPKQGCFGWGWYHYPRIVLRGSETLRGQGGRTANFAAFGSWPGVLPKNAESLRNSDALMRVAVPRRRGPAGLRGLFSFLTKLRLVRPIPETSFSSPDAPACAVPAQAAFPLALSRLGAVQGFSVLSLCLTPFLDFGDKKGR